jgi:formylglycine-generating enzyme required for sulfatase activity
MKTNLRVTMAALCVAALNLCAQGAPELDVQTYAGLTITGEIGKVYSIEYVTDLTDPAQSDWRCLEYLQLPASPYLWTDKSAPATGKRFYRAVAMEAPENMVFIPPGTFRMGSPDDEEGRWEGEGPQTDVLISRGFWMGKYEVTQGEYEAVMGNNPSWFNGIRQVWDPESGTEIEVNYTDPTRPVEQVSRHDAVAYCAALTERERGAGRIAPHAGYRLPTEAEWEYACRGWTSTRFSYGDDPGYTNLTNYAWYRDNSEGQTHPVGQKLPNTWGLYDMYGDVWEWCQDWWANSLPDGIALNPQGPVSGSYRVIRGGSWSYPDFRYSRVRPGHNVRKPSKSRGCAPHGLHYNFTTSTCPWPVETSLGGGCSPNSLFMRAMSSFRASSGWV